MCGCTTISSRHGVPLPESQLYLKEEAADIGEVIATLGPPSRLSAIPDGVVFLYEFLESTERQIGINLEVIELDLLKFSMGHAEARREALVMVFDRDGRLRSRRYAAWEEDVGRGGSFQLLFVALPTVDTRHLRQIPDQHLWGQLALQPLPVTLNAAQGIGSGAHGIEMRGTPSAAGQRTLEMSGSRR